ncbi:MAG: S8 family serine peptidase [Phycisphaerales bacterium]|nr:MAG: S8 family serine peptidase [Phycisphaerales bacterium]
MINFSAGGSSYHQTFFDVLVVARDAGVLLVASAGNDAVDNDVAPHYPASYDVESVISVASTDHNDALSSFSNWGAISVDLGAPGSFVLSTVPPFAALFSEDFQTVTMPDIGDQFTLGGPANYWGTIENVWGSVAARGDAEQSYPYRPNADGWIVTPPFDTSDLRGLSLTFESRFEMETDEDALIVEVWNGTFWQEAARFSESDQAEYYWRFRIDFKPYRDTAMRVRFGWQTDADGNDYYGAEIDNILVGYIGSDYTGETAYGVKSGTSMAAPHVAGAAALLLANSPDMSLTELRGRLIWTGDPLPGLYGRTVSGRRLNVYRALTAPSDLVVITPNGGEGWPLESTQRIEWSAYDWNPPPDSVDIYLLKGGSVHSQVADDVPNIMAFDWSIPEDLPLAGDYRIRVDDGTNVDESDADFTLSDPHPVMYVDDDASEGGDGTSWSTAYKYLQDALATAISGHLIHVAGGTYRPDAGEAETVIPGDRDATFRLIRGIELYGGYAGLANPGDPDLRDVELYETILSGDLNADDGPAYVDELATCYSGSGIEPVPGCEAFDVDADNDVDRDDLPGFLAANNYSDNSYHVVVGSNADATAVLDGFIIVAGNANGVDTTSQGGGMYSSRGSPTLAHCAFHGNSAERGGGFYTVYGDPTLVNCKLSGNFAAGDAGGMANYYGNPTLTDCAFSVNSAGYNAGGMSTVGGSSTLANCTFAGNSARYGGGMEEYEGDSTLTDCTFIGNSATGSAHGWGGGLYITNGSPTLINCAFSSNSAIWGGAMVVNGLSPTLVNCSLRGNTATWDGGGIYAGQSDTLALINCIFSGNWSGNYGGGVYNISSATVQNCTFAGNHAERRGGGMYNSDNASTTVANCILWGNTTEYKPQIHGTNTIVTYSDVQAGTGQPWFGTGCIDTDPLFVDADGVDNMFGTEDDNPRLNSGSPCIDTGDNTAAAATTDFDNNPRIMDGDADGTARVDMGAYEYFRDCNENDSPDDCDMNCAALDGACDLPGCGASGDCNTNAVPDDCDLADSTSQDCNTNMVPDECEPDCNNTGQPDDCDIAAGTSADLDTNGIPDECECAIIAEPLQTPGSEAGYAKSRYISFVPGNPGEYTALRVTLLDLPAPFDIYNGTTMWVGEPVTEVSENAGKIDPAEAPPGSGTFWSARLCCGPPIYRDDWSTKSPLHVYGDVIVPGATYEVQAIHETCDMVGEPNYSAPLVVTTSRWGDLVGHCAVIPCSPPDGVVGIPTDVTACLDKFKNLVGAVMKSRADVEPNLPDWLVNVSDVSYVLDAFRGFAYPPAQTPQPTGWTGPGGCP